MTAFNLAFTDSNGTQILHLNRSPDTSSLLPASRAHARWLTHREAELCAATEVVHASL